MTVGMDTFGDDPEETPEKERAALVYPDAQAWVTEWFLPHFRRNPKVFRWDPQWWRHEEAGTVIEAMWGSWEGVRATGDPGGMAAWFRDVFYPLSDRLTSEHGPFWNQHEALGREDVPPMLPAVPAPDGWFG